MSIKSAEQVRTELARKGVSIAQWAAANQLNVNVVYELLAGKKKGARGESHRAAVLLGLKEGEVAQARDINFRMQPTGEGAAA